MRRGHSAHLAEQGSMNDAKYQDSLHSYCYPVLEGLLDFAGSLYRQSNYISTINQL